ncbi:hypothetical protein ACQ4PT_015876 [Festuca glaucescens]
MEIRILPSPIGQIDKPLASHERIDLALADDGATLVGVGTFKRTVMYDTRSGVTSSGPEMQDGKTGGAYVVPLGDGLDLRAQPPSQWIRRRYLNEFQIKCQLTAYFTTGDRIWVSAQERGTYSFHTARRVWRKEGDWELPFYHRALFVPELDSLCFGFCSKRRHLLAVDVQQSPPVVRYTWEDTFPKWVNENGNVCCLMPKGGLVYLGASKFCIAWTVLMDMVDGQRKNFIHLMAVQIIKTSTLSGKKQLRIVKRKVCCYKMPSHGLMAHVF